MYGTEATHRYLLLYLQVSWTQHEHSVDGLPLRFNLNSYFLIRSTSIERLAGSGRFFLSKNAGIPRDFFLLLLIGCIFLFRFHKPGGSFSFLTGPSNLQSSSCFKKLMQYILKIIVELSLQQNFKFSVQRVSLQRQDTQFW